MKKHFMGFIMIMLLLTVLVGCGKKEEKVTIDVNGLADQLKSGIKFSDELNTVADDMFPLLYDMDETKIVKKQVYVSSGATAEEIFVLEATDTKAAEEMKEVLLQHIEDQKDSFESYIPEEMIKLKDPVLEVKNQYVILCVSNDNETAKKIIKEYES